VHYGCWDSNSQKHSLCDPRFLSLARCSTLHPAAWIFAPSASPWLYPIERSIMSHWNSSSEWSSTPNYVGDESDFSSDLQPNYEGYTGYNDIAVTEYPGQSSYSGNSISTPTMGSHIYTPNDGQYNTSNLVTRGTNVSSSYQDQSL
jgi:hypothetical protein